MHLLVLADKIFAANGSLNTGCLRPLFNKCRVSIKRWGSETRVVINAGALIRSFTKYCIVIRVRFITTITLAVNNDGRNFLADYLLQSADNDQQESRVVAGKPHIRCCCKIRYASKFTAASRGFLVLKQ